MTTGGAAARRRRLAAILALAVLTCLAFLPVKNADFVAYDDPHYVTENPAVRGGLSIRGLLWAATTFEAANWHPLTWASHMLDVTLFGLRPGPHHLMNLGLHALSGILLFLLLEGLTGSRWPALFAAALFAVHPLRVGSVAWVSERKGVLAVLLGTAALLAYLRYVRRPGAARYLPVLALASLGLAAKPVLVTLPLVLLLLDWWPLGRFHRVSSPAAPRPPAATPGLLLEKIPLLALSAASGVVTWVAQRRGGAMEFSEVFPLGVRLGNAVVSYVWYLGKLVWPGGLLPFYPHTGLVQTRTQIALAFALLAGLTLVAVASRRQRPWLLTGWLWYLGTLVPMIGLVQVGLQGTADRYAYLPLTGIFMAITWEAAARAKRSNRARAGVAAGAAAIVIVLATLSWNQAGYWKDTISLFSRVVAVDPRNYLAFSQLGVGYLARGDAERARVDFSRALEIKPGYLPARYNLGLALARLGETTAALEQFTAVIGANPRDAESLYNRGRLLLDAGEAEAALRDLDAARALSPEHAEIHVLRGWALSRLGRPGEAAAAFREAQAGLAAARPPLAGERREQ